MERRDLREGNDGMGKRQAQVNIGERTC